MENKVTATSALGTAWVDLRQYDQSYFDRGRPGWMILVWWFVQAIAFPLTPHFANGLRAQLLRWFGATIGQGVVIRPTARFTYPWRVELGDYCWVGDDVVFYSLDWIRLGAHSVVSQKSYLCTGSHDITDLAFGLQTAPIAIGSGAWVTTDCFVAPGVTIGANAVVGSRSSVFRDLPEGWVCFGNPCKPVRERSMQTGKVNG
jgi:putative colanic acid biosynthesis acetyltransferase WcaF